MKLRLKNRAHSAIASIMLTALIFASIPAAKVNAQLFPGLPDPVVVIGGTGTIQETLSATANTTLQLKELGLDGIANKLAQQAVRQMTTSIVRWINTGFEGSPAFVTDLGGFLKEVADNVAGDFIYGSELGFLCSPFELNIRAALEIQYATPFEERASCTLTDIVGNVNGVATSFSDSLTSWDDWFEVTTKPQNNQYGAYMLAQQELGRRINSTQENEKELLRQGNGFLSLKSCVDVNGTQQCKVVTPGSVISEQLSKALGAGQDSLISADEVNEVVGALFSQISQQALTGAGGLLGLSSGSGNSSYLKQVEKDQATVGLSQTSNEAIKQAIEAEKDARVAYRNILDVLVETMESATSAGCSPTLSTSLSTTFAETTSALTSTEAAIDKLQSINNEYKQATDEKKQNKIYEDFANLRSKGKLHSSYSILELEFQLETVTTESEVFLNECS